MEKTTLCKVVAFCLLGCWAYGITRYVPAGGSPSYSTIQAAVDASSNGDVIIVANGSYSGTGFFNITVTKNLTIKSANGPEYCTITITGIPPCQGFIVNTSAGAVIDGFTVKGASGALFGGAFCCYDKATIKNCVITKNSAKMGAGIYLSGGSSIINNCIISQNRAAKKDGGWGGGIYISSGTCTIENTVVEKNYTTSDSTPNIKGLGGGIHISSGGGVHIKSSKITENQSSSGTGLYFISTYGESLIETTIIARNNSNNTSPSYTSGIFCVYSSPTIRNCTIAYNESSGIDAGINSAPQISNCILWGNGDDLENAWSTYSCVEDGDAGTGNISSDPLFANPTGNDFHLKSNYGRWNGSVWVFDTATSLCIDAGDTSVYSNEPSPNGERINMGAYGNTTEASKSAPPEPICLEPIMGDLNDDCKVDFTDFSIMASNWLLCNLDPYQACWE